MAAANPQLSWTYFCRLPPAPSGSKPSRGTLVRRRPGGSGSNLASLAGHALGWPEDPSRPSVRAHRNPSHPPRGTPTQDGIYPAKHSANHNYRTYGLHPPPHPYRHFGKPHGFWQRNFASARARYVPDVAVAGSNPVILTIDFNRFIIPISRWGYFPTHRGRLQAPLDVGFEPASDRHALRPFLGDATV